MPVHIFNADQKKKPKVPVSNEYVETNFEKWLELTDSLFYNIFLFEKHFKCITWTLLHKFSFFQKYRSHPKKKPSMEKCNLHVDRIQFLQHIFI